MPINNQKKKTPVRKQDPETRIHNFDEISFGYNEEEARKEASRCLNCKNPSCVKGCPARILIPTFIHEITLGNYEKAYLIISQSSSLSSICSRVCPQERQCEGNCIKNRIPVMENGKQTGFQDPVAIGALERFVNDYHQKQSQSTIIKPKSNGIKIAIIGAGPAGISCAHDLAIHGYEVTIFEANEKPGGVLTYGIPNYRLPKYLVEEKTDELVSLGVNIVTNTKIGEDITVDSLLEEQGFRACFIGTGAEVSNPINLPGDDAEGVYSAQDFLIEVNLNSLSDTVRNAKNIVVVGGGNVAMDALGSSIRLSTDNVTCVYRRSENEMPANRDEIESLKEEGVNFSLLTNPVEIIKDENNHIKAVRCVKMHLGDPDESGRRSSSPIPGSEYDIECDLFISAIGNSPDPIIKETSKDLETDRRGYIITDLDTAKTSKENVYAGGDNVTGVRTVVLAMVAGKKAAASIQALFVADKQ